jgi:GABA(A) receptor-associated protein
MTMTLEEVLLKHPGRVPVIVHPRKKVSEYRVSKFLVPKKLTVGQFMYIIQKRVTIKHTQSIILFCNGVILNHASLIGDVYISHADNDDFLYIQFMIEDTFG